MGWAIKPRVHIKHIHINHMFFGSIELDNGVNGSLIFQLRIIETCIIKHFLKNIATKFILGKTAYKIMITYVRRHYDVTMTSLSICMLVKDNILEDILFRNITIH